MLANFGVHLLVAGIDVNTHSDCLELLGYLLSVAGVAFRNRDHHYLRRREPSREISGVVFNEHTEEALDRSVKCAMDHQRLLARAIFGDVLQFEALGKGEIELHRRELPE